MLFASEEDERAYFLKTQAERKQRARTGKKGMNQRGKDKVYRLMSPLCKDWEEGSRQGGGGEEGREGREGGRGRETGRVGGRLGGWEGGGDWAGGREGG